MKHLFSFPRHFGVLMIAVLLQWCVMPALAQGWVENKQGFPTDAAITKIKLKNNGGKTSGLFTQITLVFDMRGSYSEGACDISAKKLSVKTWGGSIGTKKTEFVDMEEAEDGWRVYTLPKPAYLKLPGSSECCFTNIQFFVENPGAIQASSSSATNAQAASKSATLYDPIKIIKDTPIPQEEEEIKLKTPEAEGYTLLNTKKFNGYKCDYYLEGVATLRYDNGDFATFMCSQSGYISDGKSIGDWRITLDNGLVLKKEDGVAKAELFNGATLVRRSNSRLEYRNEKLRNISLDLVTGDLLYFPNQKEPVEYVRFDPGLKSRVLPNDIFSIRGYLVGDRLYTVSGDGELYSYKQIVDGVPYSALESDTIVEATYDKDSLYLKYANGDNLHLINTNKNGSYYIASGTIHRSGGILTVKTINRNLTKVLTWPNGDKFAGDLLGEDGSIIGSINGFPMRDLQSRELKIHYGTLIKADGTRVQYQNGKSEMELAAQKKRQEAELTAEYNAVCNKYGKKYVDAALEGKPIIGMPEELLLAVFRTELIESGYSKLYRIRGWGWKNFGRTYSDSALLYSVWVTNGRVSSVRYWGN